MSMLLASAAFILSSLGPWSGECQVDIAGGFRV